MKTRSQTVQDKASVSYGKKLLVKEASIYMSP